MTWATHAAMTIISMRPHHPAGRDQGAAPVGHRQNSHGAAKGGGVEEPVHRLSRNGAALSLGGGMLGTGARRRRRRRVIDQGS